MTDDKGNTILEVYTDGGYWSSKDRIGAWAYLIIDPTSENPKILEEFAQGEVETTNNKMELQAAIKALHRIKDLKGDYKFDEVMIYTDSQYLQRGMTAWLKAWKKNNWKSKYSNQPIKNREMWEELDSFNSLCKIRYKWVRGHSDNEFNNRVDQLCQEELKKTAAAHENLKKEKDSEDE